MALGLLLGCARGPNVQLLEKRAQLDMSCPIARLEHVRLDRLSYAVRGCGTQAVYTWVCPGASCTWALNTQSMLRPEPGAAAPSAEPATASVARLDVKKSADGHADLRLHLNGGGWSMHLRAQPGHDANEATLVVRVGHGPQECEVKLVADGVRLRTTAGPKQAKSGFVGHEFHVALPYADVQAMARGTRVLGRACDYEFMLSEEHVLRLREFVMRIHEEFAWDEQPVVPPATPAAEPKAGDPLVL